KNTEMMLIKVQQGLDKQWRAERDTINELPEDKNPAVYAPRLVTFADGGVDRARGVIMFGQRKGRVPQTFQEAVSGVSLPGYSVAALPTFTTRVTVPSGGTPEQESAALLFIILNEKAVRGWSFPADDTTTSAQVDVPVGGTSYRMFRD